MRENQIGSCQMFPGKNLWMIQKNFTRGFNQKNKGPTRELRKNTCVGAKHNHFIMALIGIL